MSERQRIAILGGGISALTTAFELTRAPDWQQRYDITLYQMGWRLGGKCATSRGPNDRIEEHGIHGFLGCYYNALPLMADCYRALQRPAGHPLATFEQAFKPDSFMLMWEYLDGGFKRWPFTAPTNALRPDDPSAVGRIEDWLAATVKLVDDLLAPDFTPTLSLHGLELAVGRALVKALGDGIKLAERLDARLLHLLQPLLDWVRGRFVAMVQGNDELRRLYIVVDFLLTLVKGALTDEAAACAEVQMEKIGIRPRAGEWRDGEALRVVKGGSFASAVRLRHPQFRGCLREDSDAPFVGFRSCSV